MGTKLSSSGSGKSGLSAGAPSLKVISPSIEARPIARDLPKDQQKDDTLPVYERHGFMKCVLFGDPMVGKTALLQALSTGELVTEESRYRASIGGDFAPVYAKLEEGREAPRFSAQLCVVAGRDARFRPRPPAYHRGAAAFLFCFDLTRPETLEGLKVHWVPTVLEWSYPLAIPALYLIGCKADRADAQLGLGRAYAEERKMAYFETSALTGENTAEALMGVLRDKYAPEGRLPWEGPSMEEYLRAFDSPDVQSFFRGVGLTKPRTGLQLLIAEYAMGHGQDHRNLLSRGRKDRNGKPLLPYVSQVPRNTEQWHCTDVEALSAVTRRFQEKAH